MFNKLRYLLILLLGIIVQDAASQNSQVLYYMNLPQNHLLNPALKPTNSFYIGIPGITGINLNLNNNFINLPDVIMPNQTGDSLISFLHPEYDVDKFIAKLKPANFITPDISIQILGLGFDVGKDLYLSFDVTEKIQGNFALPKDLFSLALKGNEDFIGKTIDLSGLDIALRYFHEFGMGISKNFGNKLRIGVRGKLLFGVANMSLNNRSLGLTVNDDLSFDLNADLSANISGPVEVLSSVNPTTGKETIDEVVVEKDFFKKPAFYLNRGNMGLGLDLGAVYQLTSKISLSASITDLGYLKWKKNITTLKAGSQFKFSGFNVTDVVNGNKTFDQLAQDMVDSLKNSFNVNNEKKPFTTNLPVGISVGGSFNLTKSLSVGILSHSTILDNRMKEALTLSANLNLSNSFSTSLCYTAENSTYDNIGVGLAFRLGSFQFYYIADRIPLAWNKITGDNLTVIIPNNWNTLNMRLGFNLVFGNKAKKKNDKPMLIERKK